VAVRKRTFEHGGRRYIHHVRLGNHTAVFYLAHHEAESEEVGMTSPYRIERDRGTKDSSKQLLVLREKWPLAFPLKLDDVRPLAAGASRDIATAMGWSLPYTLGVLGIWKLAAFYCRAILAHDQRITLDGAPAEPVDAEAKDLATKRLAELTARKAAKKPATGPKPAVTTAEPVPKEAVTAPEPALEKPPEQPKPAAEKTKLKKVAATAKPVAKPKPAPQKAPPPAAGKPAPAPPVETVPETPEQLRARVRAALLRRSA
jgi:sRNA-binding protein